MSEGQDVPLMRQKPELTQWESALWNAFSTLSARRQAGMGLSPIVYSEVIRLLDEEKIFDEEIRHDYRRFIFFLDNEFLNIKNGEMKKKANNPRPAK